MANNPEKVSRWKAVRDKRKAEGICVECGAQALPDYVRCAQCETA
jgi:ribosomal protein L40E